MNLISIYLYELSTIQNYITLTQIRIYKISSNTDRKASMRATAKILRSTSKRALVQILRANRAKVKFCEQLKILMDHSSPLLVLPTSPDTRYPVGNRWNYLSHKGAVILLLTILSSSAFIASFFGTGTLRGGWTTGRLSLSSWIQYSPGRQPTPSQQRD